MTNIYDHLSADNVAAAAPVDILPIENEANEGFPFSPRWPRRTQRRTHSPEPCPQGNPPRFPSS